MQQLRADAVLVYRDESKRENLRYISNYWPIFDMGALMIPAAGAPILLTAPENNGAAREMSIWQDIETPLACALGTSMTPLVIPLHSIRAYRKLQRF